MLDEMSRDMRQELPLSPEVRELLTHAVNSLPLTRDGLQSHVKLNAGVGDARELFPQSRDAAAALAGLALRLGDWDGAHHIAQDVATREGSYWHAILHRMEPDYSNSKYWFRQVGVHPIFVDLAQIAKDILHETSIQGWRVVEQSWSPLRFIEWAREAIENKQEDKEAVLRRIQDVEIIRLWEFCAQASSL
jgi:hypothetical protein